MKKKILFILLGICFIGGAIWFFLKVIPSKNENNIEHKVVKLSKDNVYFNCNHLEESIKVEGNVHSNDEVYLKNDISKYFDVSIEGFMISIRCLKSFEDEMELNFSISNETISCKLHYLPNVDNVYLKIGEYLPGSNNTFYLPIFQDNSTYDLLITPQFSSTIQNYNVECRIIFLNEFKKFMSEKNVLLEDKLLKDHLDLSLTGLSIPVQLKEEINEFKFDSYCPMMLEVIVILEDLPTHFVFPIQNGLWFGINGEMELNYKKIDF